MKQVSFQEKVLLENLHATPEYQALMEFSFATGVAARTIGDKAVVGGGIKLALANGKTIVDAGGVSVLTPELLSMMGTVGSVGVGAWLIYLTTKKAFRVLFLKKVEKCLGSMRKRDAEEAIMVLKKLPKNSPTRKTAEETLEQIKLEMTKKCK